MIVDLAGKGDGQANRKEERLPEGTGVSRGTGGRMGKIDGY